MPKFGPIFYFSFSKIFLKDYTRTSLILCLNRIHIYVRTRSLTKKLPKRLFWFAYLALYSLFVIGVLILFVVISTTPKDELDYATVSKWEGIYICVVSVLLLAGALAFGTSLLAFFRKMRILSAELQSRTRKVRFVFVVQIQPYLIAILLMSFTHRR